MLLVQDRQLTAPAVEPLAYSITNAYRPVLLPMYPSIRFVRPVLLHAKAAKAASIVVHLALHPSLQLSFSVVISAWKLVQTELLQIVPIIFAQIARVLANTALL